MRYISGWNHSETQIHIYAIIWKFIPTHLYMICVTKFPNNTFRYLDIEQNDNQSSQYDISLQIVFDYYEISIEICICFFSEI